MMKTRDQQAHVLFISSFPPRKCGIASFTRDLIRSIQQEPENGFQINVCALDKKPSDHNYPSQVVRMLDSTELGDYLETAKAINEDLSVALVCIEHEFGLYGGEMGEYLVGFLALIEKPIIVRFHTVLPAPELKRLKIVQDICSMADRIIVMTQNSARLLREDYGIAPANIVVIPHGTHGKSPLGARALKQRYRLENRKVLTTFGLLSPNKGIETGILAMKRVSREFPDAIYLILGLTHPNLVKEEGEKYREYLQKLIADNKLENNVRFVNEYLPTRKLMEYLTLTDIYLFTSKDPNQAVSGTFIYAMSAGCPVVSNHFVQAREMLDEKTGIIIEAGNENQLADHAIRLFKDDRLRQELGRNAWLKTRETAWEEVGRKHINIFNRILGRPAMIPAASSIELSNKE